MSLKSFVRLVTNPDSVWSFASGKRATVCSSARGGTGSVAAQVDEGEDVPRPREARVEGRPADRDDAQQRCELGRVVDPPDDQVDGLPLAGDREAVAHRQVRSCERLGDDRPVRAELAERRVDPRVQSNV